MAVSFLRILGDSSPASYGGVNSWNDDEDSFEVSEVANAATSDINLADALKSLYDTHGADGEQEAGESMRPLQPPRDDTHGSDDVLEAGESMRSLQPRDERVGSVKDELRTKIQTRRVSEGVGELQVSFEPPKSYPVRTIITCYGWFQISATH